jgi:LysM repeat protein
VLFGRCQLPLRPPWSDDPIVLVPGADIASRYGGCQELPAREALAYFDAVGPQMPARLRGFVAEARLTMLPLGETKDGQVVELVRQAILRRDLVALREGEAGAEAQDGSAEQRRLIRQIEELTRGRLSYAGKSYKLVADVDVGKVLAGNDYEVVSHDFAGRVLDGLAKQGGEAGSLAKLLAEARGKLSPDWRPPLTEPNGVVLLRRNVAIAAASKSAEPVLTPSQLAKMKPTTWITIVVEDQTGEPWQGRLRLRLADGAEREQAVDEQGSVHLDGIEPGDVKIQPVLPAATTHVVAQGESLPSIAAQYGWDDWKPIYDHADNAELKAKRPNPNLLHPGDKVVIPPPENDWLSRATGQSHKLVIHRPLVKFRLRLHDADGKALADVKYKLEFDDYKREGQTNSEGFVDEPIPIAARSGQLTFWPSSPSGPACVIPVNVGHLDPVSEVSGIQARLANLGFYAGAIDGQESEELTAALELFQEAQGIEVTGRGDDATLAKLRETHDGE